MSAYLNPGSLRVAVIERTESAIAQGALQRIETDLYRLEQAGMPFTVLVASNLLRKAREKDNPHQVKQPFDPFLPPERALTVGEISDSHIAVLNKFNVVEHHLLLVTRRFEDQENLLTRADFEALWLCLREYPSLGFYNGGAAAGASQPHKHLQLVPLPLYPGKAAYPFAQMIPATAQAGAIRHLPDLPFRHAWCRLPAEIGDDMAVAAAMSLALYQRMLAYVGIQPLDTPDGPRQSSPYNLLMTEQWMLLIPRSRESCKHVSVNGLGYVGSLFVQDRDGLDQIRTLGPMHLLRAVSVPND